MTQRLALFDLDHTLLPIDTDRHWVDFLARNGWGGDPKVVQAKTMSSWKNTRRVR